MAETGRGGLPAALPAGLVALTIALAAATAQADPAGQAGADAGAGSTASAEPATDGAIATGPIYAGPSPQIATGYAPGAAPGAASVRLGDLGQLAAAPAGAPLQYGPGRAYAVTPSLGLTEEYATGAANSGSSVASNQLITVLQPAISASADSTRLHGELFYAPQVYLYPQDGRLDQVAQNGNARLLATLVPQTVFLDLRGYATQQAIAPGQFAHGAGIGANGNTSQIYSYSISPYAIHRFGPWGTGEIGASYGGESQNATTAPGSAATLDALADASNQNVTTTSAHVAFLTGEAFARYSGAAQAQLTSASGGGVLAGARRNSVTLDNGYALTRQITALAEIGYEDIHYAGLSPVTINDALWNVGLRLRPSADSTVTVRYGRQDGLDAVFLDVAWQATARIRLYANYSRRLITGAEQLQNVLAGTDVDAAGDLTDHATGAPLVPFGSFFGVNTSLYDTRLGSATAVWQGERDTVSASVASQRQRLVSASNSLEQAQGDTSGIYGTLSWSHELRPDLLASAYVQYGSNSDGGALAVDERSLSFGATLSYALSPTLTGRAQYIFNQTSGINRLLTGQNGQIGAQSLFLVSLVKSF